MKSKQTITANWRSEARIATQLKTAEFNEKAFEAHLSPCTNCRGVCCSHGFYPEDDERLDLLQILEEKEADLIEIGVKKPANWFVDEVHPEFGTIQRVALQSRAFSKELSDYPKHFPDTSCVFLLSNSRCALQTLAMNEGKHKWYYKPILCSLFPVVVDEKDDDSVAVILYNPKDSETPRPEYDGFNIETPCGKIQTNGIPAYEVLKEELEFLQNIKATTEL